MKNYNFNSKVKYLIFSIILLSCGNGNMNSMNSNEKYINLEEITDNETLYLNENFKIKCKISSIDDRETIHTTMDGDVIDGTTKIDKFDGVNPVIREEVVFSVEDDDGNLFVKCFLNGIKLTKLNKNIGKDLIIYGKVVKWKNEDFVRKVVGC